jgi:hypothetical protein
VGARPVQAWLLKLWGRFAKARDRTRPRPFVKQPMAVNYDQIMA